MKYQFKVPDMSCQHCQRTIEQALNRHPATQSVKVSLGDKTVQVESHATRQELVELIAASGYQVSENGEH